MSNKASNNLHELIHTLSSAEKRYFKIFSNRHSSTGEKKYITLFDEIEKQDEYDEDKLLEVLKNEPFSNHFSIAKNRLYHQVLKSLDAFYSLDTAEAEINQYIHYSEILFQKALYNQCSRILNTVSKMALKHEKWPALLQILKRQKRLLELQNYESKKDSGFKEIISLERSTIHKLSIEAELWEAKSILFQKLFKKGQVRDKKNAKQLLPLLKNVEEKSEVSFESKYLKLQAQSAYYFAIADYKLSYKYLTANAQLIKNNINLIKDEPSTYISVLTNLIYVCAKLNKLKEADTYLSESRGLPKVLKHKVNKDLELRIFTNTYSLELAIHNISPTEASSTTLLTQIEKELPKWEEKLSDVRKAGFYHSISTLYFIIGDFKKSLFWNNKLLNTIHIDQSEDQYCFGKIFHLLVHLELDNQDVISHALKSLMRYLETRKRRYRFEDLFLELMHELSNPSNQDQDKIFHRFIDALNPLQSDKYESVVMEYFDFISWAESKLQERNLREVLQEKAPEKDLL